MSIESNLKKQYAKLFTKGDVRTFKLMAEYYLQKAAVLKTTDIAVEATYKLLVRNVQKRLFIGIGSELLLKSFFLLNGYCVNKLVSKYVPETAAPHLINSIPRDKIDTEDTLSFNVLIQQLPKVVVFSSMANWEKTTILRAFNIAKVFRNKEGHVATLWHQFDSTNYSDIEAGLVLFYKMAFSQNLDVQFSFEKNEKGHFAIKSTYVA